MKRKSALLCTVVCSALALGSATSLFAKDTAKTGAKADKAAGKVDKSGKPGKSADKSGAKAGGEKAGKPINTICPVDGGEVDASVTTVHKGKTIGFCCEPCIPTFKKDPAKYLKIIDEQAKVSATKEGDGEEAGEGEEPAETEPAEGGEGTEGEEAGEGEKPEQAELNAKCPVSGDDVDPANVYAYKGRDIGFCCEGCIDDFKKTPEKFVKVLDKDSKAGGGKKPGKHKHDHDHEDGEKGEEHEHAEDEKADS